jgi:ABC-2 type transport system ATP-binding protein
VADGWVIETADLRKRYAGTEALSGLDLQVPSGSIFGFLGRNGAGKTTTIKILLGMARATSGTARVFGLAADTAQSSVDIRRRVGFVSDEKDLYDNYTVDGIIRFTAPFYPKWRADLEKKYLHKFDLPPNRKVKALSRGMRTKLALLLALSRGADLLILDEPTSGLDPAMTEEVLQVLVSHVAAEEMSVFFSSHQLSEVEQIADHIAIIHRGRAVVAGALDDLRGSYRRIQVVFEGQAPPPAFTAPGVQRVRRDGRVLTILASSHTDRIVEEARQLRPITVDVTPVTLKDIFLDTVSAED